MGFELDYPSLQLSVQMEKATGDATRLLMVSGLIQVQLYKRSSHDSFQIDFARYMVIFLALYVGKVVINTNKEIIHLKVSLSEWTILYL